MDRQPLRGFCNLSRREKDGPRAVPFRFRSGPAPVPLRGRTSWDAKMAKATGITG